MLLFIFLKKKSLFLSAHGGKKTYRSRRVQISSRTVHVCTQTLLQHKTKLLHSTSRTLLSPVSQVSQCSSGRRYKSPVSQYFCKQSRKKDFALIVFLSPLLIDISLYLYLWKKAKTKLWLRLNTQIRTHFSFLMTLHWGDFYWPKWNIYHFFSARFCTVGFVSRHWQNDKAVNTSSRSLLETCRLIKKWNDPPYLSCYDTFTPLLCYYKHRLVHGVPWGTYRWYPTLWLFPAHTNHASF